MHVQRAGRHPPKPLVELSQIRFLQEPVGAFQIADLGQPQRLDQPILQHPIHPFHPPLGLRAVGQNQFHPQRGHSPAKLRLRFLPSQLLRHNGLLCTAVDAVPVHI